MIPLEQQRQIREAFKETLKERVKLDFFTQRPTAMVVPGREECAFCHEMEVFLHELTSLNPLLSLSVHELNKDRDLQTRLGIDRVPALVMRGVLNRPVTFFGAPLGLLIFSVLDAVVLMSTNKSELVPAIKRKLKRLHEPVNLQLFVSLDSPYCARMITIASAFAVETKLVKTTVIEVAEFPRWSERYQVKQVPFTVLNERVAFPGVVDAEALADQIVKAATNRTISVSMPKSQGATSLLPAGQPQAPPETVRPSGLIIPGR